MVHLRTFDAFPKVDQSYVGSDPRTRPLTYLYLFICLFFLYMQTTNMMGATEKHTFDVDGEIKESFQINLDVFVKSPCSNIYVYLHDSNDDRLMVNELIRAVPIEAIGEGEEEQCALSGSFLSNRVSGELIIESVKRGPPLSHFIRELSFGEYLPSILNPLDMTQFNSKDPTQSAYFLTIIPTTYKAFGIELETSQYTVTESHNAIDPYRTSSIHFVYDFDPIRVTISDSRMSFFAWLCRVTNIFGGALFAVKAVSKIMNRRRSKAQSESSRYSSGLLGEPASK